MQNRLMLVTLLLCIGLAVALAAAASGILGGFFGVFVGIFVGYAVLVPLAHIVYRLVPKAGSGAESKQEEPHPS